MKTVYLLMHNLNFAYVNNYLTLFLHYKTPNKTSYWCGFLEKFETSVS